MSATALNFRQQLEDLADRVVASDPGAADRLRELGDAIEGGPLFDAWAAADVYRIIDPDTIVNQVLNQATTDRQVRMLELVRNVTIFLPILVTWVGVALAVDNYSALLLADRNAITTPFLALWQQGFGGRLWLTLSHLGWINGCLLLLVFVLTLLALFRANQVSVRTEEEAMQLRRELAHALANATLMLEARRLQTPTTIVDQFKLMANELIGRMEVERQRIGDLADQRERELSELTGFAQDLRQGVEMLLSSSQSSGQTYREMAAGVLALNTLLQDLTKHAEELITAGRSVAQPLNQIVTSQANLGLQLSQAATGLEHSAGEVSAAAERTLDQAKQQTEAHAEFLRAVATERAAQWAAAQTIAQSVEILGNITRSLLEKYQGLTDQLEILTAPLQLLADGTGALLNTGHEVAIPIGQLAQQQQQIAQQIQAVMPQMIEAAHKASVASVEALAIARQMSDGQDGFLQSLSQEREAQADLARMISRSTDQLDTSLDAIQQVSVSLHAIAVDLSELQHNLPQSQAVRRQDRRFEDGGMTPLS